MNRFFPVMKRTNYVKTACKKAEGGQAMKKKWISVILAAVMGMTAVGCGAAGNQGTAVGTNQENTAGKETSDAAGESTAEVGNETSGAGGEAAADESVKATLTYWDYSANADLESNIILKTAIEKFHEKYPNVTIEVSGKGRPEQLYDALSVAFSADNGPDMFWANVGGVVFTYVENGKVLELTDFAQENNWSDIFYGASLNNQETLFGGIYALPKMQKTQGIFYRKDLYEKYGFSVPKSMDEFYEQCKILQNDGIIPIGNAGKWPACTSRWFDGFLEINGGTEVHDQLLKGETSLNCDAVVQSFYDLQEVSKYFQEGHLSNEETEVNLQLFQGQMCFTYDGTWQVDCITDAGLSADDFGFFSFPASEAPRANSYGDGIFVNASSENQDLIKEFLKCYQDQECYKRAFEQTGQVTVARVDAIDESKLSPLNKEILDCMNTESGSYMPSNEMAWPAELSDCFLETIDQIVLKEITPEDAAAKLDTKASEIGFYR